MTRTDTPTAAAEERLPVLAGRILITGPSGTGKTMACAQALAEYVQTHGAQGVAVLEFAPAHTFPDGGILGRRLDEFLSIPAGILHLVVPTQAPRASTSDVDAALTIAKRNAEACHKVLMLLPDQVSALFVNDASMAFHVPGSDPNLLLERLRGATLAVVTSLDPVGFDPEHPITKQEHRILEIFKQNVDHVVDTTTQDEQGGAGGDAARIEAEGAGGHPVQADDDAATQAAPTQDDTLPP